MTVTTLRCGAPPERADSLDPRWLVCDAGFADADADADAVAALAADALRAPRGLPPLAQWVTPEDRVAIVIAHGAPAAGALARGVVEALEGAGIAREQVRIVAASEHDAAPLREAVADVTVERHEPRGDDSLCFVGLGGDDLPLLVNRTVFEADVVLPVGIDTRRTGSDRDTGSAYDALFPAFFDAKTIERARAGVDSTRVAELRIDSRREEAERAGRMVAAPVVLRVVPGPGGGVAAVVAGTPADVLSAASGVSRRAWRTEPVEPAELVVAVVSGGADQQTWASVGRALGAATRLVRAGGAIALWTELAEPVTGPLALLAGPEDGGTVADWLAESPGDDARAATQLLDAIRRGTVYLRSRLEAEEVEALGLAPVASAEELLRLVRGRGGCTLLTDAQHVRFDSPLEDDT